MPNIKSAKKRVLVIEKKNTQNKMIRSEMKTAIKKFNAAIEAGDAAAAEKLLPATVSVIDSAASKGVIHKNNAANKKSSLAKSLNALKAAPVKEAEKPAAEEEKPAEVAAPAAAPAQAAAEEKPKKARAPRAKKAAEEEAPAEEKPKKTRAKKVKTEDAE